MPLTEEQHRFVTNYVARTAVRDVDRPGKIATPAGLEAALAKVGRVADKTLDEGDRARAMSERQEAHARDVLLRDQDGLNVNQIVNKLAPVTEDERKLARTRKDATNTAQHAQIDAAQAKMAKQRDMQLFVSQQMQARRDAEMAGGSNGRDAINKAIADMATAVHENSISHHASRHGPQTAIEDHVVRIATDFAPDNPLPPTIDPNNPAHFMTITTRGAFAGAPDAEPITAKVPIVQQLGPNAAGGASRSGSGLTALYMIEDALAKVHESRSYGAINAGDRYVIDSERRSDGSDVGEAAGLENVGTASNPSYRDAAGAQVPSAGRLANASKTASQKEAVVKKRAEAVLIERHVKSSKVVVQAMPDGSFRTITAFPDARVAADAFGKSNGLNTPETPKSLDDERASAQQAALAEAETYAAVSRDASGQAKEARKDELKAKADAYHDALATVAGLVSGGDATDRRLMAASVAAMELDYAESERKSTAAALDQATATLTTLQARLGVVKGNVQGLVNAVAAAETDYAAAADDGQRATRATTWQRASEALGAAQSEKAYLEGYIAECATLKQTLSTQKSDAEDAAAEAKEAFEKAFKAAAALAGADAAKAAIRAQRAVEQTRLDLAAVEKDLRILEDKARLAETLVEEIKARIEVATPPDPAEVEAERAARTNALADALAEGPEALEDARRDWAGEIDGVAEMFRDDAVGRAQSLAGLKDRFEQAKAAADATDKLLRQKEKALSRMPADPAEPRAEAEAEVAGLKTKLSQQRAASARLKSQVKAARVDDQRQQKLDDASIAVARSVLDATVADVEAKKAAADGATDQAEKLARAEKAAKTEALRRAEHAEALADIAEREARHQTRLQELSRNQTRQSLRALDDQLAAAGPDQTTWSDEAKAIKQRRDRFAEVLADADRGVSLAHSALKAATEESATARQARAAAERALKALG